MMQTVTPAEQVPPISRDEAHTLAATEYRRMHELLRDLGPDDWPRPTDCTGWDVRALTSHVLGGTEAFTSFRELVRQARVASRLAKTEGVEFVDAMTAAQVRDLAGLTTDELVARVAAAGPRAARFRSRVPAPLRLAPMKEQVGGVPETWRFGYLLDVILTRDTWMHRVDIARATGRDLVLDVAHDGRLVADIVAEWARRHGQPFTLHLTGPAGGTYTSGGGGDELTLDAIELCRVLSGRGSGEGLLAQAVPF